MSKIKTTDLSNDKKLTAEQAAMVNGGPHYINWDIKRFDIASASSSNSDVTLKRG